MIIGRYFESEKLFGSEKFIKRLYENLNAASRKVSFVDFFFGYKIFGLVKKVFGKTLLDNRRNNIFYRLGVLQIAALLFRERPASLLITNLEGYGLFAAVIGRALKIKIFYFINGIYQFELEQDKLGVEPLYFKIKNRLLEKLLLRISDVLIVPSAAAKLQLKEFYPWNEKNIEIIPHGVDRDFFNVKEESAEHQLLRVVYAGGYGRGLKGFDFLISALQKVEINIKLVIAGSIQRKAEMEAKLKNLPENIDVEVRDYCTTAELAKIYQSSDVGVIPSKFETFSITAIEMAASSLALILTESTGAAELFENKKSCLKIPFDNIGEFVKSLQMLDRDRKFACDMGLNANRISKELTWVKVTRKLLRLLNENAEI